MAGGAVRTARRAPADPGWAADDHPGRIRRLRDDAQDAARHQVPGGNRPGARGWLPVTITAARPGAVGYEVIRLVVFRVARRVLTGRLRNTSDLLRGRLTRHEVTGILGGAAAEFARLARGRAGHPVRRGNQPMRTTASRHNGGSARSLRSRADHSMCADVAGRRVPDSGCHSMPGPAKHIKRGSAGPARVETVSQGIRLRDALTCSVAGVARRRHRLIGYRR
jgi:hypothetical protein